MLARRLRAQVADLKPAAGQSLPVKPLMARTTPTPNELLTPPTYATPDRVDELMKKSQPRPHDPFDLPPPTGGAAPSLPAGRLRPDSRERANPTPGSGYARRLNQMPTRVRKAVFPVAGLGTRLLPATKSIPKEMITIVDRPLIQYAVDEAREAGIEQLIFVTGRGKSSLVDYFDHGLRARDDDAASGQEPRRRSSRPTPSFGEVVTRPPAAAARPRPCGVVRAPHRRRRAVRGAASRRADGRKAQLPRADGRGL